MSGYTKPEWPCSALITIDTQCDTLDGQPFEIPGTSAVVPHMRALVEAFRAAGRPVIHIIRLYQPDGSNVDPCRRALVEEGAPLVLASSPGSQLAAELLPRAGIELDAELLLSGGIQSLTSHEVVIYKPRWGAFYQTPLEAHLRRHGVSTLVFSGCNYPNCPRTSIYEASERDFRVVLVEDAVSGLYDRGRREMTNIGVELWSTATVVEKIRRVRTKA